MEEAEKEYAKVVGTLLYKSEAGGILRVEASSDQRHSQPGGAATHCIAPVGQVSPTGPPITVRPTEDLNDPVKSTGITPHF